MFDKIFSARKRWYAYELRWQGQGVGKNWKHIALTCPAPLSPHDLKYAVNKIAPRNNPIVPGSFSIRRLSPRDYAELVRYSKQFGLEEVSWSNLK